MEVKLLTDELDYVGEKSDMHKEYSITDKKIDILITGIGPVFTTFHLTQVLLNNKYDLLLCIGIAGSLSPSLKIGEVVNVISEEFADLGIESKKGFLTLFESGFIDENEFPFEHGIITAATSEGIFQLKNVRGITTGKSHVNPSSIEELNDKFNAQVESMEGAAVFYVCSWLGIPCWQIRAVSNFVEMNDPAHWNIPLALDNLKSSVLQILHNLSVPVS
jgi:futalosine hydrolase